MPNTKLVAVTQLIVLVIFGNLATAGRVGFYIPGTMPIDYYVGDPVPLYVNSLRSLSHVVPYDYYHLPFCQPRELRSKILTMGQMMWGDRIQSSAIVLTMKKDEHCALVPCHAEVERRNLSSGRVLTSTELDRLEAFINRGYRGDLIIDNLPLFSTEKNSLLSRCTSNSGVIPQNHLFAFQHGYAIGVHKSCLGKTVVNNHVHLIVKYHETPFDINGISEQTVRVVGFTGEPHSIRHEKNGEDCSPLFNLFSPDNTPLTVDDVRGGAPLLWSYSVRWVNDPETQWASRWDDYLKRSPMNTADQIHFLSVFNSVMGCCCMIAMAVVTVRRQLQQAVIHLPGGQEQSGEADVTWRDLRMDVFRAPSRFPLLAQLVGCGAQLLVVAGKTCAFAVLGFLSPANGGALLTSMIISYVFAAFISGVVCGKILMMSSFPSHHSLRHVAPCGFLFPGILAVTYIVCSVLNATQGASDAVSFSVLATWTFCFLSGNVLLALAGGAVAIQLGAVAQPFGVDPICRIIPASKAWRHSALFAAVSVSAVSFGAIFTHVKMVLLALWEGSIYYVFGFASLALMLWSVTIVASGVVAAFYTLDSGNYHWWWRSFVIQFGGLSSILMAYCTYFYFTELELDAGLASFLYFAYMSLLSMACGLAAGSVGFLAALLYVRKIYSAIKIDED